MLGPILIVFLVFWVLGFYNLKHKMGKTADPCGGDNSGEAEDDSVVVNSGGAIC